jgi:hypothetical protein
LQQRIARAPQAGRDVFGGDNGKGRGQLALLVGPPAGVGNVDGVVRVQRDVDVKQLVAHAVNEGGQALHVLVGTGDGRPVPVAAR